MNIARYSAYRGKNNNEIKVFIEVDDMLISEASLMVSHISWELEQKMAKNWKYLPSLSLPEAYNIVTLPYAKIEKETI